MWTRRKLIETAAFGATGLVLATRRGSAQDAAGGDHAQHQDAMWKACADTCADCAKACNKAFHHCVTLAAAGKAEHARMAQIAADCAAFCTLSSEMLSRSSTFAMLSCTACAEACKLCAQECSSVDAGSLMKACSDECRRCEDSCRKMVHAGTGTLNTEAPRPKARPSN
jgi:hypothetical protein